MDQASLVFHLPQASLVIPVIVHLDSLVIQASLVTQVFPVILVSQVYQDFLVLLVILDSQVYPATPVFQAFLDFLDFRDNPVSLVYPGILDSQALVVILVQVFLVTPVSLVYPGIPDVLTLCEAGLMAIGAKNNKAVLSLEWQTGFKRFVEVVKPSQVIYVPDNERPAFWNAKQDNVRYWHETFQRLVPKSWCVDWRQLQRQEFEAYRAWCVSWWKQQHRKPQRDEDTFAWQKSDVNDLWCAATSKAAFLQTMQRCFTRTPLYPTMQFGSKPKVRELPIVQDVERALAPLVRKISDAPPDLS